MASSVPAISAATASISAAQPSPPNSLEEEVHALINSGRTKCDPANLTILSKYVNEQIIYNTYDFNSNLAVLHIYILYPQCFDFDVCRKILIKGLMNLPSIDFSQYLYLIPDNKTKDPKISCIIKFNDDIQACKFKLAWEDLKEPPPNPLNELLNTPNFVECLRKYIADIINITFVCINLNDIMGLLNFNAVQEFEKFARIYGWVVNVEEGSGGGAKGGIVIVNTKTDEQSSSNNTLGNNNANNANKQANKHSMTSPVYASQGNALNTSSITHYQKPVEKHMSVDGIKMCFAALQR